MSTQAGRRGALCFLVFAIVLVSSLGPFTARSSVVGAPVDRAGVPGEPIGRTSAPGPAAGIPAVESTISLRTGSWLPGNVPVPNVFPASVAADPIGGAWAVTSSNSPFVALVGEVNHTLGGYETIGAAAGPLLFAPGSSIAYVGEAGPAPAVQALNVSEGQVGWSDPTPSEAAGLAWDPLEGRILAGDPSGALLGFDASNGTIAQEASGLGPISSLSFDPFADTLLVTTASGPVTLRNGTTFALEAQPAAGPWPIASVYDPLTGDFYIANYQSTNLTVVNGSTGAPLANLSVGRGPHNLALSPNGSTLYVANALSNNVTIVPLTGAGPRGSGVGGYGGAIAVAPATGELVVVESGAGLSYLNGSSGAGEGSTQTSWDGEALAVDPIHESLYVTNADPGTLEILNLTSENITRSGVPLGASPYYSAYDPATTQLFVSDFSGENLSVYNATQGRVVATLPVGLGPNQLAVDPAGGYAFVGTEEFSPELVEVSTRSDSVVTSIDAGCPLDCYFASVDGAAYSPVTGDVYTGVGGSAVSAYQAGTLDPVGSVGVGDGTGDLVASPYNSSIYVTNSGTSNVSVIDGSTLSVSATYSGIPEPTEVALDPENGYLFVVEWDTDNVSVIDTVTGAPVTTLSFPAQPYDVVFDPTTGLVFVSETLGGAVAVVAPNTAVPTLASVGISPPGPVDRPFGTPVDFGAIALSQLGVPLSGGVTYAWTSSSPRLGTFNSSLGADVAFTTGSTNLSGTIWVNATYLGTSRSGSVSLDVEYAATPTLVSVVVSPAQADLEVGGAQTFEASGLDSDGAPAPVGTTYSWSVLPPDLGTLGVPSGADVDFRAAAVGTGSLAVSATYQGTTVTGSAALVVTTTPGPTLEYVSLLPTAIGAYNGSVTDLFAIAVGTGGANLTDETLFQWALSDPNLGILTVTGPSEATFELTVRQGGGSITVTGTDGNISNRTSIAVEALPNGGPTPTPTGIPAVDLLLAGATAAAIVVGLGAIAWLRRRRGPDPPARPTSIEDPPGVADPTTPPDTP